MDENGHCVSKAGGQEAAELFSDVLSRFYTAVSSLRRPDFSGAFRILDLALRSVERVLPLEDPVFIALCLRLLKYLHDHQGCYDILGLFKNYLRRCASSCLGENHKLTLILRIVSQLDTDDYNDIFRRLFELLMETSDEIFGTGSSLSTDIFYEHVSSFIILDGIEAQALSFQRQLNKIGEQDVRQAWMAKLERNYVFAYSEWKCQLGQYEEAERSLLSIENTHIWNEEDEAHYHISLGYISCCKGSLFEAEKYYRAAVREAESYGHDTTFTQTCLGSLAAVLDFQGKHVEASQLRKDALNRLHDIATQVHWDVGGLAQGGSPGGGATMREPGSEEQDGQGDGPEEDEEQRGFKVRCSGRGGNDRDHDDSTAEGRPRPYQQRDSSFAWTGQLPMFCSEYRYRR
jgi:hypothetical protein